MTDKELEYKSITSVYIKNGGIVTWGIIILCLMK